MSRIDTTLAPELRERYLAEVRSWLPAFLATATVERRDPLEHVEDLLRLEPGDLRRVVATHVLLTEAVAAFVQALPGALRAPVTNTERPRQQSRVLAGGVDWGATARARSTGSPLDGRYVTRPAVRAFDVPPNRVLRWAVAAVAREAALARVAVHESQPEWQQQVRAAAEAAGAARKVTWLRSVQSMRPLPGDLAMLRTSRRQFYRCILPAAADVLRRYESPPPDDVADLLVRRWFEPTRDWQLFELLILLRLDRTLAQGASREQLRLTHTRGPFSAFRIGSNVVRLWYQTWPASVGPSEQLEAAAHYGITTAGARPDIVVEVTTPTSTRGLLLELKATRSSEYLGGGLLQLLAYLRDRPALFQGQSVAWLVAPPAAPLTSRPAEGRALWAVDADGVAAAVADAVVAMCH